MWKACDKRLDCAQAGRGLPLLRKSWDRIRAGQYSGRIVGRSERAVPGMRFIFGNGQGYPVLSYLPAATFRRNSAKKLVRP